MDLQLTEDIIKTALISAAEGCTYRAVAKALGITRKQLRELRTRYPEFGEQIDDAIEDGLDLAEERLLSLGRDGYDEPVFYKGVEVGAIHKYSVQALQAFLKARRPTLYNQAPRQTIDVNIKRLEVLSDEDLMKIIEGESVRLPQPTEPVPLDSGDADT